MFACRVVSGKRRVEDEEELSAWWVSVALNGGHARHRRGQSIATCGRPTSMWRRRRAIGYWFGRWVRFLRIRLFDSFSVFNCTESSASTRICNAHIKHLQSKIEIRTLANNNILITILPYMHRWKNKKDSTRSKNYSSPPPAHALRTRFHA